MYKAFALSACLILSACQTPVTEVFAVPDADQQQFLKFKQSVQSEVKPNEALVYIVHTGLYKQKEPLKFVVYNDVQLRDQQTLRFKKDEYVKYSVQPGSYHVTSWMACMPKSNAPLKAGDEIYPQHPGYVTLKGTHPSKFGSPLNFEAGKIYVFTYNPECWWNRVDGSTELFMRLKAVEGENALFFPFKATESKQKIN
jgi:hypothetical protein